MSTNSISSSNSKEKQDEKASVTSDVLNKKEPIVKKDPASETKFDDVTDLLKELKIDEDDSRIRHIKPKTQNDSIEEPVTSKKSVDHVDDKLKSEKIGSKKVNLEDQHNEATQFENVESEKVELKDKPEEVESEKAGVENSIIGFVPLSSSVKSSTKTKIANWVMYKLRDPPNEKHKYVELEFKYGQILDTYDNLRYKRSTENVFNKIRGTRFDMQVTESDWNSLNKYLDDLETSYQDESKELGTEKKLNTRFIKSSTTVTDKKYNGGHRFRNDIRVSIDKSFHPPKFIAVEKLNIGDLYIQDLTKKYDLKLSMSVEMPIDEPTMNLIMRSNRPGYTREKRRISWVHSPTACEIQLTTVKSKVPGRFQSQRDKYEVEIEIHPLKLSPQTIDESIEKFLNNAQILNEKLSSPR